MRLGGIVGRVDPLRYTPAGKPVLGFMLEHRSQVTEAGQARQAYCRMPVIAIGLEAAENALIQPQAALLVEGFVVRERLGSEYRLVLHAQHVWTGN